MADQADEISEQEKQTRNEMLFTLSERDRGTLAMVITPNEWKRKELHHFLKEHLTEYEFFDIDLTSHTYTSLYRALQEKLPPKILQSEPVQYLISVTGLESSLYKTEDGRIEFSSLIAQLNFERELIFNQPYIILLWISDGFDKELQRKAPDLMHWMSKRFVFEDNGPDGMEVAEAAIAYGEVAKRGKIKERLERIMELEETWAKLRLHNEDKARLVKDKINLLRLLGKEYAAAFELPKAEEALMKAIGLNNKIQGNLSAALTFDLAWIYYQFNRFEPALKYFLESLKFSEHIGIDLGDTYHMIGMSYQGLRKWDDALSFYRRALEWYENTENEYESGGTLHQIGTVYLEQRKWEDALLFYKQALEWKKKTGNELELSSTYHQIGCAYQGQRKWEDALSFFNQAIEWRKKINDEYEFGATYHQIGRVYEDQGKWEDALLFFKKAIEWDKKVGNEYELGKSYYCLGRVNEAIGNLSSAETYYQQSIDNFHQYQNPAINIVKISLEKVQELLSQQPPSPPTP